jgi:hypothetical protein
MSELLKINVNDHIEKKGNLSYLSWAWAWAEVLKIDPGAAWNAHEWADRPAMFLPDGTAMVKVSVEIKGNIKTCVLPVMDNRNRAIVNPDAFAINTAIMRCLAKAIAMHGLGLYIYAGEDLPEGEEKEAPKGFTTNPRGDLGTNISPADRDPLVAEFRAALDLDAEEKDISAAVYAIHDRIKSNHDLYVAVSDALNSKERSALKAYIKMAKEQK